MVDGTLKITYCSPEKYFSKCNNKNVSSYYPYSDLTKWYYSKIQQKHTLLRFLKLIFKLY